MTATKINELQSLDPTLITSVVRQSQHNSAFELLDWTVTRFGTKAIANPDGLFLLGGRGHSNRVITPWSVVLKILKEPEQEVASTNMWYWKREFLAYQSGLLKSLPGPIIVPRCYGLSEHDGEAWIWMEHIQGNPGMRWTLDDYVFAAHELGQFNGNCLSQGIHPEFSWLSRDHARNWFPSDLTELTNAFDNVTVKQAFSPEIQRRVIQQWRDREKFFNALDCLPQVFSHYDFTRRNLISRERDAHKNEIAALDWAWCGYGALGGDLYSLLGASSMLMEMTVSDLLALDELAYQAYLDGLREAGWAGDPDLVRLAYVAWTSLWVGAPIPRVVAWWISEEARSRFAAQFECSTEEFVAHSASLCEFGLDRADEAWHLIHKLGLD